ncbi:MAG: ribosome small subunit-dependent GTPase A [Butyrivibrio sp.]|nr:ribosome small subunit-dependent GTPase A [Butyrivibrio sp.]
MQGKIVKGISGFYYVDTADGNIYECKAKGVFRSLGIKPLVGDDVIIDVIDEENFKGNVTEVLPRKNQLLRPPVANVDQAVILFAIVKPNPSYNLLDRFLIMMQQQKLPVVICFNKQDIATRKEQQELSDAYEKCGYRVMFISVATENGIDELKCVLKGKTTVVAGPSGVGKSSLLNLLHPEGQRETGELSRKIDRGKNTTRHSELFFVPALSDKENHTFVMDTPGFTSLEMRDVTTETLQSYYTEFARYEPECKFGGCSHISEPVCGIKEAVERGDIAKVRYENYCILYEELKAKKNYGKSRY